MNFICTGDFVQVKRGILLNIPSKVKVKTGDETKNMSEFHL